MWALASVVRWHGTALLTVAAHADSGLSAPAVICQTERMQGSEFLELREKRWRKWEREGTARRGKKGERKDWQPYKCLSIHITHTHRYTHWAVDAPLSVWHWCCQTNQGTLSLTCSLVLENKPDSCDVVVVTPCRAVVPVFGVRGSDFVLLWCSKQVSVPLLMVTLHDTSSFS